MGNTSTSVHIALDGTTGDAVDGIVRAYATLGYESAKTASPESGKHVVLLRKEGDAFLSIYDSDNAALDTGELKDLALAASKIFKTAAVCTSLYDSDTFEVVVFNAGKQVDLVMTQAEQYSGPLKVLSAKSRATQWSKIFGKPLSAERITQAITRDSAFADDALAELSQLIGLSSGQSQLHYQDLREDEAHTHHLRLTKSPSVPRAAAEGQIVLRNYFDPDNSRMLLVVPASWPIALLEETRVTWLMLSEGAGFNDGTLAIHVDGPGGLAIASGYMEGSKFHNGQIVGPLETAPRDQAGASVEEILKSRQFEVTQDPSGSSVARTFTARFPALDIPTKEPARPTQILIVLQLHLVASRVGEWEINVSVRPASGANFQHDLPRARIAAVEQTWLPVVSGLNPRASYETGDLPALQPKGPVMLRELQQRQAAVRLDRRLDPKDRLDDFAAHHAVLQAWHSQDTWQPLFDHADDYHRTVYEEHSVLNWFRGILQTDGGLNATKMSLQWCSNVLRMVTPHMWICRALLEQVDRAALDAVAQVSDVNDAFRIALKAGRALDDLELALLPVLPVESVRVTRR